MVHHTFSSGMFYGYNRRSLRSDKASFIPGTQMNTDTYNWKTSLSSTRRQSLPPFPNGHRLRSTKLPEITTKSADQNDPLHVVHNGVNSSHCYGTRYGGRNSETSCQKHPITKKTNHWGETLSGLKHSQTTSSFLNLVESDNLFSGASNLGHKLRSRHVHLSSNLISLTTNLEDDCRQPCKKTCEPLLVTGGIQECDDDLSDILTIDKLNKEDDKGSKISESKHCQNQGVKRKRLTAEEKLIEDNKAYYKLEVKNNKLRSSGFYLHQKESSFSANQQSTPTEIDVFKETIVTCNGEKSDNFIVKETSNEKPVSTIEVKRNKIRLSELSLLNDEAENFMFGESTHRSDSDDEDGNDNENNKNCFANSGIFSSGYVTGGAKSHKLSLETNKNRSSSESEVGRREISQTDSENLKNAKNIEDKCIYSKDDTYQTGREVSFQQKDNSPVQNVLKHEENSFQFCSFASNDGNRVNNLQLRHRKQTQVETFLNDNIEAYKFEVSSLQPCIQVSMFPHKSIKMQTKLESENKNERLVRTSNDHTSCRPEHSICVALPCTNYSRHGFQSTFMPEEGDNSENNGFETKRTHQCTETKSGAVTGLQFSFEGIPKSEPWYQTYQRQDEGEEFYLSSVNDCTYWKSFLLPYEMPLEQFNTSGSVVGISKTANMSNVKRRKRKMNSGILDKKPRKSPRCHASTLAILSSLMHHRKRKESEMGSDDGVSKNIEENRKEINDSSIALKTNDAGPHIEIKELAQNIDQLLGLCTEIGLSSDTYIIPPKDMVDEMNCGKSHKVKTLKCKKPKTINMGNTKRSDTEKRSVKDCEGTDVDPIVLEKLAVSGENPLSSIDDPNVRNRGGPCMDVISLLNGYGTCYCMEGLMKCKDMPKFESDFQSPLKEICNSSECASSTCETIQYSDVTENVNRMRGKKRRRKKNLTGWPVEKQKIKRRLLLKLARPEVLAPVLEVKVNNKDERLAASGSSSNSGLSMSKSVSCIELQDCDDEQIKLSDSGDIPKSRNNFNEVCEENPLRNTINSRCIDAVVTDADIANPSDVEFVSHSHLTVMTSPARTTEKLCISRTTSIDSSSQHCDFQPRVRVKKMNSVADINFMLKSSDSTSAVINTRQLRSTSFSSSSTLRKNLCPYEGVDTVEVVRRASSRIKKSCSRWDSWSTRRRR